MFSSVCLDLKFLSKGFSFHMQFVQLSCWESRTTLAIVLRWPTTTIQIRHIWFPIWIYTVAADCCLYYYWEAGFANPPQCICITLKEKGLAWGYFFFFQFNRHRHKKRLIWALAQFVGPTSSAMSCIGLSTVTWWCTGPRKHYNVPTGPFLSWGRGKYG